MCLAYRDILYCGSASIFSVSKNKASFRSFSCYFSLVPQNTIDISVANVDADCSQTPPTPPLEWILYIHTPDMVGRGCAMGNVVGGVGGRVTDHIIVDCIIVTNAIEPMDGGGWWVLLTLRLLSCMGNNLGERGRRDENDNRRRCCRRHCRGGERRGEVVSSSLSSSSSLSRKDNDVGQREEQGITTTIAEGEVVSSLLSKGIGKDLVGKGWQWDD